MLILSHIVFTDLSIRGQNVIKIAVVEDSREYAEGLRERIQKTDFHEETSIDLFGNAETFLKKLKTGERYHLCFSDVRMPGMDGVVLAEEVREIDCRMLLVFLSSWLEYATEGYRVQAFDYLLKSRLDDKWELLTGRILKRLREDREKVYRIKMQDTVKVIPLDQIIYIYKEQKYCNFVLEGMRETVTVRKTISEVESELASYNNFLTIKRGIIINMDKIRRYSTREIVLENGEKITVGRVYISRVRECVIRYMEEIG